MYTWEMSSSQCLFAIGSSSMGKSTDFLHFFGGNVSDCIGEGDLSTFLSGFQASETRGIDNIHDR